MKTNLDYYNRRTDAHRHPKFKTLRLTYGGGTEGWAAEGRFWALNDIIADSEMCQIDLSIKRNKADLAETLGFTLTELDYFIQVLISDDVELLFEIEPGIFSTKKVKETLQSVLVERDKARDRYGKKSSTKSVKITTSPEKGETSGENLETSGEAGYRVKESKVKESKLNKSKGKEEEPAPEEEETLAYVFEDKLTPYFFTFSDFADPYVLRKAISDMLSFFCKSDDITKASITRLFNAITGTENLPRDIAYKIALKTLQEYKTFTPEKRNILYLFSRIEGKLKDTIPRYREWLANKEKNDEKKSSLEILENDAEDEESEEFKLDLVDLINSKKVV